jgi:hypothetical protein
LQIFYGAVLRCCTGNNSQDHHAQKTFLHKLNFNETIN